MKISKIPNDLETYLDIWKIKTFSGCIENLNNHLAYLLKKHYASETLEGLRNKINREIELGKITAKSLAEQYRKYIFETPGDMTLACKHYIQSYFITQLIANNLHEKGKLTESQSMLIHCGICLGQLDVILEDNSTSWRFSYDDVRRNEIAASGGDARGEIYAPARQHLASLIINNRPDGGWVSQASAASRLAPDLFSYACKHNIPLQETSIVDTIKAWMRKYPAVQEAILASLKKKK